MKGGMFGKHKNVGPDVKDSFGVYYNYRNWKKYHIHTGKYNALLHYPGFLGSTPKRWCWDDAIVKRYGTDTEADDRCIDDIDSRVSKIYTMDQIHDFECEIKRKFPDDKSRYRGPCKSEIDIIKKQTNYVGGKQKTRKRTIRKRKTQRT
jgi:hypothetical protein